MDADVFMALKYMALQILIAVTYIVFFLSEHAFHSGTYKVHGRLKGEFNHEKKKYSVLFYLPSCHFKLI